MLYTVTNDFIKINESSGTIQNNSQIYDVELSDKAQADSGVLLFPLNKFSFSDVTLYARCVDGGGWAKIRVVPFTLDFGVAAQASDDTVLSPDEAVNSIINDAFNDNDIVTEPDADELVLDMWNSAEPVDTGDGFSDDINAMFNNP